MKLNLPAHVQRDLQEAHATYPEDYADPATFTSPAVALDAWLTWKGIHGYTSTILDILNV